MSEVELRLTANLDDATREVAGFRKEYAELVKAVEKPLRQVNAFRDLEGSLESTSRELRATKDNVRGLASELASAAIPTKEMQADYRNATNELRRLERQESMQVAQLRRQQAELKKTGIDTRNLATEQRRLSQEYNAKLGAGQADAALTTAKKSLGVGQIEQSQAELVKLRQQYRLLGTDGRLSAKQRAEAESAYRKRVSESLAGLRALRAATAQQASPSEQAATAELGHAVAATTSIRAKAAALALATREQRLANIEAAKNNLGISQSRAASEAVKQLARDYQLLRTSGNLTGKELVIAQQQLKTKINETRKSLHDLAGDQQNASTGSGGIGAAVSAASIGYTAVSGLGAYVQITDAAKKMNAQLLLVTSSQKEFNTAQADTYRIAQDTRAPLEDVVTLYARLTPALRGLGYSQGDVAGVTDALSKALRISGATTAETSSAFTQFSQALASGVLRGEEFNSVAESAPRLMRAMAEGLGVPVGALRDMASDGKLTADIITDLALKALPQLTAEAAKLPDTVEGAFTRLKNDASKAFGSGDTSGLINAVTELSKLLKDPVIVQGLTDIAAGMATLAGWAVIAASEFGAFAKELGYTAAAASGQVAELDKLEKTLAGVKAAQNHGNVVGRPTITFFMSPEDLARWSKELEDQIAATKAKIYGITVEQQHDQETAAAASLDLENKANQEHAALQNERLAAMNEHTKRLASAQEKQLSDAKAAISAQQSLQKSAQAKLKNLQKEAAATNAKYLEARARLGGNGASAEPTYANAQALKVGARDALQRGDVAGAKRQADAALKVLEALQAAGGNTYGLQGFSDELLKIEQAADGIKQSAASDELASISAKLASLKEDAKALKDIKVTPTMDYAAQAFLVSAMQKLAADLGQTLTVKATVIPVFPAGVTASTAASPADLPALASGGPLRGPGTGTSDSILMWGSNGEFMQPEAAVRYYGAEFMEDIRRMRLPKFATGGSIGGGAMPRVPSMSPGLAAALGPSQGRDLGRVSLNIAGETHSLLADSDSFARILQLERLKRGRS
ncbi:MAG: tape measure protein [Pseudomonadaceae bacterium]|nr:tape measure protein [Pseudomonadaceae bacterium]